jgi:glycosyltransferase involved in cell wall biosynthesis
MKHVVFVAQATALGGAERSLVELVLELHHGGAWAPLVAVPGAGPLARRLVEAGVPVLLLSEKSKPKRGGRRIRGLWALLLGNLRLWRQLRGHPVFVVHVNGLRAFPMVALAAIATGTPLVLHLRDFPRRRLTLRLALRLSAAAIVPSAFLARQLPAHPRLHVVPNAPADLPQPAVPREEFRRQWEASPDDFVVVMVAQLVPWKRHDLFIGAAARCARTGQRPMFWIVGHDLWEHPSRYESGLRKQVAREGLEGRVVFLGEQQDMGTVLAASDLLVLPSDHEPFGRVVLEAWGAGCAVVVSDNGAPAELVTHEESGLVFEAGSEAALAAAIMRLVEDVELRRQLVDQGRRSAGAYTAESCAASVAAIYESIDS